MSSSGSAGAEQFTSENIEKYKKEIVKNINRNNDKAKNIKNHQIHHQNLMKYKKYYKILLIISIALIILGFIFVLILYFLNDERTKSFDGLTYTSLGFLAVPAIIITVFVIIFNNYEYANNFGDRSKNLISYLQDEIKNLLDRAKRTAQITEEKINKLQGDNKELEADRRKILETVRNIQTGKTYLSRKEGQSGIDVNSPVTKDDLYGGNSGSDISLEDLLANI